MCIICYIYNNIYIYIIGWQGLYRGMSPTLVGAIPYEGIKFYTYDWCVLLHDIYIAFIYYILYNIII